MSLEKRYIWIARWKLYDPYDTFWATYLSKKNDLSFPYALKSQTNKPSIFQCRVTKNAAIDDMLFIIGQYTYYDFIVVRHPEQDRIPFAVQYVDGPL
jgi:hypothetical protein